MSVELDNITSGYNLSKINSNFQKVETYINDKLLARAPTGLAGEAKMERDLDMNSNQILNLPYPSTELSPVRIKDLTEFASDNTGAVLRADLANTNDVTKGDALVGVKQPYTNTVGRTQHSKNTEIISVEDFGALGDGTTNNTVPISNALSAMGTQGNKTLHLGEGRHLVTGMNNYFGVEFEGPGNIGISDGNSIIATPEIYQLNSYADKHKYCFGTEYMYAYYHATRTDNATPGGLLKCVLAGDSTMHGGNGEPNEFKPEILMTQMFRQSGVPNISLFNRAVPSTSWGDMDIISDLGASTRLLMIKYGVNDAFGPKETRHQNMLNAMRAKLQEIRSQPFGGVEWLSIILVGPNSTNDSPNMRNEEWYESIRGIYAAVAREFKCAYFDTYALFRDSRIAAGLWMDNPFSDGRAIHPLSEMNMWIYGKMFQELFGHHMLMRRDLNSKVNLPIHVEPIAVTDLPLASQFSMNESWHHANVANGWDFSGISLTRKQADGLITQTIYNQANSRIQHRSKPIATNTWNRFTGKAYPLTLGNGWINFGGSYNAAAAILTVDGTIVLTGTIKSGTTGVGDAMFSLPTGFTPKGVSRHLVSTNTAAAVGHIEIQQNGQALVVAGINNTLVSLEGITLQLA